MRKEKAMKADVDVSAMLKHYAEFHIPPILGGSSRYYTSVELKERDIYALKLIDVPIDAVFFRFVDRIELTLNGRSNLTVDRYYISGRHFIEGNIVSLEEFRKLPRSTDTLMGILNDSGIKQLVKMRNGSFYPFNEQSDKIILLSTLRT